MFVILIAALATLAGKAYAFGELGHEVIAALAQDMLTPKARAQVQSILATAGNGGPPPNLAGIAVWADKIRSLRPETRPWHFANIQIGDPGYDPARVDTPNVLTALDRELAVLRRPAADRYSREEALKWVVHLVGDLHQPLHVGEDHDRGGNDDKVKVNRRTYNLHAVWDFVLLERLHLDLDSLHAMLAGDIAADPAFISRNAHGTPRNWVDETHVKSRACYLLHGKPMRKGIAVSLDRDYIHGATLMVLDQLKIAGVRLAFVLNAALDPAGPRVPPAPARAPPHGRGDKERFFAQSEPMPGGEAAGAARTGRYAWSVNSKVYHFADCADVARIKPENLRTGAFPPPGKTLHAGCPRRF